MKTILALALFIAIQDAGAQDTVVYRWPLAYPKRPAMELSVMKPDNSTVAVGATTFLHAMVMDSVNHQFHPGIHWKSSDTTIAVVGATGDRDVRLTGQRKGRVVITAYTDSLISSFVLFVGPVPPVARLDIVPKRATIGVGESIRFLPMVRDAHGLSLPNLWLLWSWSDDSVAYFQGGTLEHELVLEGVRDGEVTIYADLKGKVAEATLVVGAGGKSPPVRSIVLTPVDASVRVGDDIDFTTLLRGDRGAKISGRLVRWSSCDSTMLRPWTFVPMKSDHITYHALRAGTCGVTARMGAARGSARVTIRPE
jgi:hypothetical protein